MELDIGNLLSNDFRDIPFLTDLVNAEFYSDGLLLYPEKDLLALKEHIYAARDYYDSQAGKLDTWTNIYEQNSSYAARCCLISIHIREALKSSGDLDSKSLYILKEARIL